MNPRQRRGALLIALSAVGAAVVFASVLSFVGSVHAQVGDVVTALRLSKDVPAYVPVTRDVVEAVRVPRKWLPQTVLADVTQLQGRVAGTPLRRGSYLQADMLVDRPDLGEGQREIAILIDAETGVAGKVQPGGLVDIYATFQHGKRAYSQIIVRRARVIDVGKLEKSIGPDAKGGFKENLVVPITFGLSVRDSLVLTHAESFAVKVRLALIGSGDSTDVPFDERIFELTPPKPASTARKKK
jgi:pilus assembly protein CpaB